jgi:flavin-dependent dehydrogenase
MINKLEYHKTLTDTVEEENVEFYTSTWATGCIQGGNEKATAPSAAEIGERWH